MVVAAFAGVAMFLTTALSGSASVPAAGLKVRYEKLDLPTIRALNAVKLDLVDTPPVPTARIEAAIRVWGNASQSEFAGLSKLPVARAVKQDIASLRHWTSLLVADLEAYHDGQFPSRTEGDIGRHNAAAARLDHDFGVPRGG
jgi:hypothetical protein